MEAHRGICGVNGELLDGALSRALGPDQCSVGIVTSPSTGGSHGAAHALARAQAGEFWARPVCRIGLSRSEPSLSMPAALIAVCNQKGRRGQDHDHDSNLGDGPGEQGRRVLPRGFDPQGALSVGLGIQPHEHR